MLPLLDADTDYRIGDVVIIKNLRDVIIGGESEFDAVRVRDGVCKDIKLSAGALTEAEKQILLDGCLINYYKRG